MTNVLRAELALDAKRRGFMIQHAMPQVMFRNLEFFIGSKELHPLSEYTLDGTTRPPLKGYSAFKKTRAHCVCKLEVHRSKFHAGHQATVL